MPSCPITLSTLLDLNSARPIRRICRNTPIRKPDINKRLHRLEILVRQQPKQFRNSNEVNKAAIEISPAAARRVTVVDVPERIYPMRVVDVGVHAEDLAEDGAAVCEEVLRKAGAFANPVAAGELVERSLDVGWTGGDGGVGVSCV